jgi:hypothetical protein
MTVTDKLPLITESVAVSRIDIHPAGEEPDQHTIRLTHIWQSFISPYYVEIEPLVLRWSLGSWPHSPSKSKSTTRSREVQFNIVVTKSTRLIGSHKTRYVVSTQLKTCHRGQNDAVINRHEWGLPHRNLRIATTLSSHFPSSVSLIPLLAPPGLATTNNQSLLIINHIILVHEKRVPICEWDLPLGFYR